MDANDIKSWIEIVQGLIEIAALIIGSFWAWSRFVVERGLVPASEMDLSLKTVGSSESATIVEIAVRVHNKGSAALVVTDLRVRLRYLDDVDNIQVVDDPKKAAFGRVTFPHASVLHRVGADKREVKGRTPDHDVSLGDGEFLVVPYDTFVQPGVEQVYTFVTALPRTSLYVLARASFRYEMHPSRTQLAVLRISRKVGMIQYSLDHIRKPHTVERSFKIGDEPEVSENASQ